MEGKFSLSDLLPLAPCSLPPKVERMRNLKNVDGRWSVHRPPVHPSTQYCFSKNYYIYNNVRAILFYYYIFIKNRIRWTVDGGRFALC